MRRLFDRSDLILLVARESDVPAIRRACVTGHVEVLGGFSEIPSGNYPGWLLRVTAKHGARYIVAVVPDAFLHRYRVYCIETVPWQVWVGEHDPRQFPHPLRDGDRPGQYHLFRACALKELQR